MNMAVVGAARVVFGADTSDFDAGAKGVEGVLGRLVEKFQEVEKRIKGIGAGVTLGITVPFAAMVRAVDKGAGSFQGQMKKVEAALGAVSGEELKQLSDMARTMGPAVGKGATEAAEAIEALGLAGVSTADIMGGALKAALDLSAAGMVDAGSASSLVTDIMGQFKISAAQLPGVVQKVVGALDTSKFGFDDFRLAVGQGGAVAASAGVGFMDFATAISATSTQFTSGADAGTSFKTYIQSLVGNSNQAKAAMKKLGISFFDVQTGQMKPLAEQAQILRDAIGGLTDDAKTEALKTIFGSDASRTAIGLMEQGADGFNKLQAAIAGGDVEAKIQKRMEGSEAAGRRIAVAWESVKIALGMDTGLLDIVTAIKNGFARMLEAIANAPPAVLKVGAAFSALAAAIGPLLVIVGHLGAVLLAHFAASRFGLIGKALGLIIAPVSTLIGMLGEMGLARVLMMVGSRLLALAGPVGWAIGAFLLFKDQIIFALSAVWKSLSETLGPPLEAIITKVGAIFSKLSSGPVGTAVAAIVTLLSGLADVVGTVLVGAILLAGEIVERVMTVIVTAISWMLDIVSGAIDVVSALLNGDFSGAWEAVGKLIDAEIAMILAVIGAFVPEISASLKSVYEEAKQWLAEGFQSIVGGFTSTIQSGVNYATSAFPNVVAAAKSVYTGVKGWLVDKFGGLMTWVGNAAKWIGDQYAGLKKRLGLGESGSANNAPPPTKPETASPTSAPAPKRSVNFDDDPASKKKGGTPKGRNTTYDAGNRQQLADDIELEAARLRGDREAERAIRTRLELSKQIEAYQRTGLGIDAATAAAKKDMATLEAARREGLAKDLERDEAAHQIDLARIAGNRSLEETLARQEELKERIAQLHRDGQSIEEATARALRQQLDIDKARAEVRKRMIADDEQDRQLRLAQARGDSEERIRALQREIDIRERQRELERDFDKTPAEAKRQATEEWDQMERARQTGVFRDTFKDGVRAALDGDLKGWFKNWWRDRVAKGMEEALNSLADLIASLFANAGHGSGSGGGILGSIVKIVGGALGGSSLGGVSASSQSYLDGMSANLGTAKDLPGFKTGGTGVIKGKPGIDANLISFRATAGEIMKIERPGNDNGPNGIQISMPMTFSGAMDLATKTEAIRFADAARQAAIQGVMEANRRRG
ncbi:phage tail tape measure protein [Sphingobium sp. WCS2017Hpa-17]|uniref:phage tail tape measure protein n=1 Tax=Sphingobium sp. WCS2017Hpa-17 TaxID=3073638 RepID=UPI00288965FC|nr:phage tail tape measure protein [Sphingobium sp. WCS2017Hpa-17]